MLFALTLLAVIIAFPVYLYNDRQFALFEELLESVVFNKQSSASGQARAQWNLMSLQSFFDTRTLGVGFGSSRASRWIVAVISQIGLLGARSLAALVMELPRSVGQPRSGQVDPEVRALHDSARACALAWLVGASIVSGSADPGLPFFVALATILACRTQAQGSSLRIGEATSTPVRQ